MLTTLRYDLAEIVRAKRGGASWRLAFRKLSRTIQSRIRWPIAKWMDRYDDTCWGELGLWALIPDNHEFREILEMRHSRGQCIKEGLPGWCGKCDRLEGEQPE